MEIKCMSPGTGYAKGAIVAGSGKKWLVGCGVGCGAVVLLGILLTVGGSLYMMKPFNKAVDAQKALEAEYGTRETYIPLKGTVAGEVVNRVTCATVLISARD